MNIVKEEGFDFLNANTIVIIVRPQRAVQQGKQSSSLRRGVTNVLNV